MQQTSELAGSTQIPRAEFAAIDTPDGPGAASVRVLVVEDEAVYGHFLLRTIERCGSAAILVGKVREAREQLASGGPWTALIVDVLLPDGSGLDLLREARERGVHAPALIITGLRDPALAHAAFELRATYLVKPVEDIYVQSLLHHAAKEAARISRLSNAVATYTIRHGLSEAESHVLLLAAQGHERVMIARIRCSSEATIKNHIHSVLQKTGDLSLREAVSRLRTECTDG